MNTNKKGKKIKVLVTAGPTWVKIDRVRVISNIFTGKTGFLIARAFRDRGFRVTLLLGPSVFCPQDKKINIIRFKYFEELRNLIVRELKDRNYKAVIHSAAISDFTPCRLYKGKISSSKGGLALKLRPAPKIIKDIRRERNDIFLVQFKLEVGKKRKDLINVACNSLVKNNADLVVANDLEDFKGLSYRGYIIDKNKNVAIVRTRKGLAHKLIEILKEKEVLQ